MADDALTPREVAESLGVTVRTVQRWIADGRLPAARVGGRLRVSRSSLGSVGSGLAPTGGQHARIGTLLIANRGEIALRVARSARRLGIRTIGVHAPDERPPDGMDGVEPIDSYLHADGLLAAARRAGADAVHPGYGFLSENASFARAVQAAGLTWVGPPSDAIAAMGDKAAARRIAAAHGVPVLPGYDGSDQSDATLRVEADRIGLPLLVKPAAGGGGKGMRVIRSSEQLDEALAAARREAQRSFGNDRLILERLLDGPRHVEIQVLFDAHGHGIHLGERDCSTQRRNQKVLEEAPGPAVPPELRERMGTAALAAAAAVGYVNAGTVEFLLANDGGFFFLEMNTRLQVEHPVTELVAGRDLVADQLRIAAGVPLGLEQGDVRLTGHAIEARVYAEDPEGGFLPATGRVEHLRWPDGVRVDAGVREGDEVSDRYDPMLAKVIAAGDSRAQAIARLREALDATELLGVRTNLRFLRWLLEQPVVLEGEVRTDTLGSLQLPDPAVPSDADWERAAAAAAVGGLLPGGAWGGGWRLNAPRAARIRHGEEQRTVAIHPDQRAAAPSATVQSTGTVHLDVDGQSLEFSVAAPPSVEEAVRHAAAHGDGHATLTAPMPGRVISVRVSEGTAVAAHDTVVVLEAMKMEHAVVTPIAGTVVRLAVGEGRQVQRGELLAEVSA